MKTPPPNRWLYGGYIHRVVWPGDPGHVLMWNGEKARVETGDTALLLRTGAPLCLAAGVEPAGAAEVVHA